jgi:hypothetical protein
MTDMNSLKLDVTLGILFKYRILQLKHFIMIISNQLHSLMMLLLSRSRIGSLLRLNSGKLVRILGLANRKRILISLGLSYRVLVVVECFSKLLLLSKRKRKRRNRQLIWWVMETFKGSQQKVKKKSKGR